MAVRETITLSGAQTRCVIDRLVPPPEKRVFDHDDEINEQDAPESHEQELPAGSAVDINDPGSSAKKLNHKPAAAIPASVPPSNPASASNDPVTLFNPFHPLSDHEDHAIFHCTVLRFSDDGDYPFAGYTDGSLRAWCLGH